ncbi:hypothetical protein [Planococcus halotolerans]|uniref:hypothetical protein n=1 Tax=Planococcus halotolerans TaxID=2233542 RepID=UPI001057D5BD|nr:hypothetical protein [Planococcus halotolerans]
MKAAEKVGTLSKNRYTSTYLRYTTLNRIYTTPTHRYTSTSPPPKGVNPLLPKIGRRIRRPLGSPPPAGCFPFECTFLLMKAVEKVGTLFKLRYTLANPRYTTPKTIYTTPKTIYTTPNHRYTSTSPPSKRVNTLLAKIGRHPPPTGQSASSGLLSIGMYFSFDESRRKNQHVK